MTTTIATDDRITEAQLYWDVQDPQNSGCPRRGGRREGAGRPALGEGVKPFQLTLDAGRRERYQAAADRAGVPVAEWMRRVLDRAERRQR